MVPHQGILELSARRKIFSLVECRPGLHIRELERLSDIPYSTLTYHLHFLTKHNLISSKNVHGVLQYFPCSLSSPEQALLSLLRQKTLRQIILFFFEEKVATPQDLVEWTSLSSSTIHWHTTRLVRSGILVKEKQGKLVQYRLGIERESIVRLLIHYRESFVDSLVNKIVEMWEFG